MDEVFSIFLKTFGGPVGRQEVPKSSIERYKGKLPDLLLHYWSEHGWCGYGEGIFWMVNPQEYEGVTASWIQGTEFENQDTYHLIARSAFGELYFWGEETGASLKITSIVSRCTTFISSLPKDQMDKRFQNFLLSAEVEYNDFDNLFQPAKKTLGTLSCDEMYGFVPAIMLGGSDALDNLKKVRSVEHLVFLSQLSDLEVYDF
ncbi:GAD-like domain-containing protein [Pseudomonas syringae pv. actinidifoliorum]|nr:GAD-like domain-containing protein [Pseudomonas syringae pv. actinidifoliorum]MDU8520906.1 GAD-like domain-containing protein [Pseudomonas syringae pv. actinidifoliorum]MDU8528347.1 GAD-like domain-containing protein [Pseudomonas syringae pv. actinidifoliorum]